MLERKAVGVPYNGVMSENSADDVHPATTRSTDGHGAVGTAPAVDAGAVPTAS